ncbi:hypothetical protein D3C87_601110 [compost metagenome]
MSEVKMIEKDFSFRQNKEGYKRPTVTLVMGVPSLAGLATLLTSEDQKVQDLLVGLVQDTLTSYTRTFVEADAEFSQEKFDALVAEGKISIEAIANLPKSERNTIGKEDLEEFAKDYVAYMPEITGKDVKKVQMAAGLFIERFKRVAGDNTILAVLQEQLGTFAEGVSEEVLAKNERVVMYLSSKLEELLSLEVTADAL